MKLSRITRIMCGLTLITIPTIQYGGVFLLSVLSGYADDLSLTPFQTAMFRAGHGHAGVIVILSLICQILVDHTLLPNFLQWFARVSIPLSAVVISGGFFGSAIGEQVTSPNSLIVLIYVGLFLLAAGLVVLGVGLLRSSKDD